MRIVHVVEASNSGVGRHVLDLAAAQVEAGDEVDVFYGDRRSDRLFLDRLGRIGVRRAIAFRASRAPGLSDLRALWAVRREVQRCGAYDIIHGHASKGGAYVRLLRRHGAKVVYTPNALVTQSPEISRLSRWLYTQVERRLARRTDGLICVSQNEAQHARSIGLAPRSSTVINNGLGKTPFRSREEARRDLRVSSGEFVVGFVGRLVRQKGLDLLVAALPLVVAPGVQWRLVVAGEGDQSDVLRAQADELRVADRITWLGWRDGPSVIAAFDLLALPSRYEGFPYVALEALQAGVPLLATSSSGASELLGDPPAGLLVESNSRSLAAGLTRLLSERHLRDELARSAAAALQPFGLGEMTQRTREFYEHLLAVPSSGSRE